MKEFIISHDGDLLSYRGQAETVCIPEGVKRVMGGAFGPYFDNRTFRMVQPRIHCLVFSSTVRQVLKDAVSLPFLEELELNEGLRHISNRAFHPCALLRTIRLPSTLRFLGAQAFEPVAVREFVFPETIAPEKLTVKRQYSVEAHVIWPFAHINLANGRTLEDLFGEDAWTWDTALTAPKLSPSGVSDPLRCAMQEGYVRDVLGGRAEGYVYRTSYWAQLEKFARCSDSPYSVPWEDGIKALLLDAKGHIRRGTLGKLLKHYEKEGNREMCALVLEASQGAPCADIWKAVQAELGEAV